MTRDRKEYLKKYHKEHKEEQKEYRKKYRENNRDKVAETSRKYREKNKVKIRKYDKERYEKNYDKIREQMKGYRKNNREFVSLSKRVSKYYNHYFRYISSLENYLTIMKLEDCSLKRSIMVKLGHGTILEDEAVVMSGMTWSDEEQKELDEYLKRRKPRKQPASKC